MLFSYLGRTAAQFTTKLDFTPKKRAQRMPGKRANLAVTVIQTLLRANVILAELIKQLNQTLKNKLTTM